MLNEKTLELVDWLVTPPFPTLERPSLSTARLPVEHGIPGTCPVDLGTAGDGVGKKLYCLSGVAVLYAELSVPPRIEAPLHRFSTRLALQSVALFMAAEMILKTHMVNASLI
ncbi:hypothetical protein N7G274_008920 [Stereocaulon virgatum]|uniref:Uncharacterized protein n=1 Tax=Stereocaulon virgatum TaxID=373712 RepID=A0ABR3ZZY2_9LECA